VFTTGDLDTLGALACELAVEAGVDPLRVTHQVIALDLTVATVNPGANGITAATLAADAGTELRTGLATAAAVASIELATRTVVKSLGTIEVDGTTNSDGGYTAISMLDALDASVTVSGTWNGATATIETCEDPAATVPTWTTYDDSAGTNKNPLTADGTVTVIGPHTAVRVKLSNDGASTSLAISVAIRKPAGA
jgi:hypothetical protein